jgi:hypothetical protein
VLKHERNHIRRLAGTLFTENENQLIRVVVLVGEVLKRTEKNTENQKQIKHKTSKKESPPPGRWANPSQTDKAFNQANAKTNERHNDKHQQQGLGRNAGTKRRHPRDSLSDKRSHIRENLSHGHGSTPLQANQTPNQANTQTHERHNDEHENQGIGGNSTDKGAYPLDSLSNEGRNIGKNSSDSNGGLSLKTFHLSNKIIKSLLSNARYIPDNTNDNNEEAKADKIAERLRHQERGKMLKEPENERLHISHGATLPQA